MRNSMCDVATESSLSSQRQRSSKPSTSTNMQAKQIIMTFQNTDKQHEDSAHIPIQLLSLFKAQSIESLRPNGPLDDLYLLGPKLVHDGRKLRGVAPCCLAKERQHMCLSKTHTVKSIRIEEDHTRTCMSTCTIGSRMRSSSSPS